MKHEKNGHPCRNPDCWCHNLAEGFKVAESWREDFKPITDTWYKVKDEDIVSCPPDMVNNPAHYQLKGLEVEALDVIEASLTREEYIGYLIGNCLKYSMRAPKKNGEEDLKKMCFYAKKLEVILETTC